MHTIVAGTLSSSPHSIGAEIMDAQIVCLQRGEKKEVWIGRVVSCRPLLLAPLGAPKNKRIFFPLPVRVLIVTESTWAEVNQIRLLQLQGVPGAMCGAYGKLTVRGQATRKRPKAAAPPDTEAPEPPNKCEMLANIGTPDELDAELEAIVG